MANAELSIAVLGGGIRGTAIAALLAQTHHCKVRLLEKDRIAAGATSTNHGRLHIGTSLWRSGPDTIIERRRAGSELMRKIPGAVRTEVESLHLVEATEQLKPFEAICERLSIQYKPVSFSTLDNSWITDKQFAGIYTIPEYSFNPAHLAGRFATQAMSLGAYVHTDATVSAIDADQRGQFLLRLVDGRTYEADIVINALGAWANQIHSELPLPQLDLKWPLTRLLCLRNSRLSKRVLLDRVVTIIDKDNRIPGAIPHGSWIIFGCDLQPEYLASPDDETINRWSQFDAQSEMDHTVFEVHAKYFLPLQSIDRQEMTGNLFSFSGIYPHLRTCKERFFQIHQSSQVPNYYAISGGNATTALLDAIEVIEMVLYHIDLPNPWTQKRTAELREELIAGLTNTVGTYCVGMVWEDFDP